MRYEELYVAGVGSWLPGVMTPAEAVAAGEVDQRRANELLYESATVAGPEAAPAWMAAQAARQALARSAVPAERIGLVLHATNWFQGLDMWPVGSYVANEAGARHAQAFEVRQRCNGGMGALDLAAGFLSAATDRGSAALLTTGDRMALPRVNRWTIAGMGIYGDGGTALVLSKESGFARVISVHTEVDNSLELLARGDEEFMLRPPSGTEAIDLDWRSQLAVDSELPDAIHRLLEVLHTTKDVVLADAGVPLEKIARLVIPHTRQGGGHRELENMLGIDEELTTWQFGKTVGHLASGDQFAGIGYLIEHKLVAPGDHVLVWGGGAGYTCTAAVLEILSVPEWGAAA